MGKKETVNKITDPNIKNVYENVKKWINNGGVTMTNIVLVVPDVIQTIEKLKIKGSSYKKQIAMEVIKELVLSSDNPEKEALVKIVEMTVPPLIDTMIKISKNEINLNKKSKKQYMSCSYLFCM